MAAKLIIAREAEEDISRAYSWFESRRAGLGEEFLSCVDACIQSICRLPELPAIVRANYRRRIVRRFPYVVFYEYAGGVVTVYCVFHSSQDPEKWQQRLQ